jgi:hypothetical protein
VSQVVVLVIASVLAGAACGKRSALPPRDGAVSPGTDGAVGGGNDAGMPIDAGATIDGAATGGRDGAQGGAGGGGGIGPGVTCTPEIGARVPPAPLRRLSSFAYANTVRDVLGLSLPVNALPPAGDPWDDGTATLTALTDAFHSIAHDFALASTKDAASVDAFTRCDAGALGEATCAQRFVASLIPRLFRRPLDAEDAADFAAVFAKGRDLGGTYASGVRAVIEVALQSPEFLYMVEFGEALVPPQPGVGRPRPHEMATRLSYLLWGAPPDDALTEAAAQDRLWAKDQIEQQARRLLADGRAHDVTRDFYARLLRIGDLDDRRSISTSVARSAGEETTRFVEYVVWTEGRDFNALLGGPFTFVDETLAQLYGIPGVTGAAFQPVSLLAQPRRGVLTQVSMLATGSLTAVNITHPSERGALIFEQFLCGDLTQTPSAEQHTKPPRNVGETPRQWLERVTAPAMCRSCHQQIDPLGLAFEHYAYYGAWRDTDGGLAVDARGTITGIDTAGSFDGAIQLIDRLAPSRDVHNCHVRKWMETAYGRPVVAADACSQAELENGFANTGGNIRELMIGLTQTEAFLYRPAP